MAATVTTDPTNDTKKIAAAMNQLGKDVGDIEKSLGKIKKLQAVISKKPEECAKAFKDLFAEVGGCVSAANDLADLPKSLKNAVYK